MVICYFCGVMYLSAHDYSTDFDVRMDAIPMIEFNTSFDSDSILTFADSYRLKINDLTDSVNVDFTLRVDIDFYKSKHYQATQYLQDSTAFGHHTTVFSGRKNVLVDCLFNQEKELQAKREIQRKNEYSILIKKKDIEIKNYSKETSVYSIHLNLSVTIVNLQTKTLREYIFPIRYFINVQEHSKEIYHSFNPKKLKILQIDIEELENTELLHSETDSHIYFTQNYSLRMGIFKIIPEIDNVDTFKNSEVKFSQYYYFTYDKKKDFVFYSSNIDKKEIVVNLCCYDETFPYKISVTFLFKNLYKYNNKFIFSGTTLVEVYDLKDSLIGFFGIPFCRNIIYQR